MATKRKPARRRSPDEHRYKAQIENIRRIADRWGRFHAGEYVESLSKGELYRSTCTSPSQIVPVGGVLHWPVTFEHPTKPPIELLMSSDDVQVMCFESRSVTLQGYEVSYDANAKQYVIEKAVTKLPTNLEDPSGEREQYEELMTQRLRKDKKLSDWQTLVFRRRDGGTESVILSRQQMLDLFDDDYTDRILSGPFELFYEKDTLFCLVSVGVSARGKESRQARKGPAEWEPDIIQFEDLVRHAPKHHDEVLRIKFIKRDLADEDRAHRLGISTRDLRRRIESALDWCHGFMAAESDY